MVVKHQTLADNTYDSLKELILTGHFTPGQRLQIDAVSLELGVSPTPLREAFFRLEKEGLLEIKARKGTYVRMLNRETVLESYEIREVLEGLAARLAAERASPADIDRLKAINNDFIHAVDEGQVSQTFEINILFHGSIALIAGNKKLSETLNNFFLINMFSNTGASRTFVQNGHHSYHGHINIIKAIESHDPDTAESIVRQQIRKGADKVLLALSEWRG